MLNLKYYLILLISVFLSLGLGMIIGISLEGKSLLENQHNAMAQRLEEEFLGIRNENLELKNSISSLKTTLERDKGLNEITLKATIKGKLEGMKVAFVEVGNENESGELMNTLKMAGAEVVSSIAFDKSMFLEEGKPEPLVDAFSQETKSEAEFQGQGHNRENLSGQLARNLVLSLHDQKTTPLFEELDRLDLIQNLPSAYHGCDAIVLVGSYEKEYKKALEDFTKKLNTYSFNYNLLFLMVQKEKMGLPNPSWYKENGISTIDHIDTLYGRLSLVSLLYGVKGNFGYNKGVDGVMPEILFPAKNMEDLESQVGG